MVDKSKSSNKELKVLSLFSGIGAFEKALTNIGVNYSVVGFSEIDKYATTSYCVIHGIDKSLNLGDIAKINNKDLPKSDLVTYGFPCQDISIAGQQKGIRKGTRSGLLFQAERIIQTTKPKYAVAENVKNLLSKTHIKDFKELLKRLDSYGYNSYYGVLNAKDFNVPQNRERVFIVSIRKDVDKKGFTFPSKKNLNLNILDILDIDYEDKYILSNDKSKELLSILKSKGFLDGKRFCTDSSINDPKRRDVSNCITARYDGGIQKYSSVGLVVLEPSGLGEVSYKIRKLKPIEVWRLMGFSDKDYLLAKTKLETTFYNGRDRSNSQMYKQAGNSIVVPVLEDIFKNLLVDCLEVK